MKQLPLFLIAFLMAVPLKAYGQLLDFDRISCVPELDLFEVEHYALGPNSLFDIVDFNLAEKHGFYLPEAGETIIEDHIGKYPHQYTLEKICEMLDFKLKVKIVYTQTTAPWARCGVAPRGEVFLWKDGELIVDGPRYYGHGQCWFEFPSIESIRYDGGGITICGWAEGPYSESFYNCEYFGKKDFPITKDNFAFTKR